MKVVMQYAIRMPSPAEVNYCMTRHECFTIIHGVKVLNNYLINYSLLIRTDHSSLKYLYCTELAHIEP